MAHLLDQLVGLLHLVGRRSGGLCPDRPFLDEVRGEAVLRAQDEYRLIVSRLAYPASFTGGVQVATADANGDGRFEIRTSPNAGIVGDVRAFDGVTQTRLFDTTMNISSFGEDEMGELYVVNLGGTIGQFVALTPPPLGPTPPAPPAPPTPGRGGMSRVKPVRPPR